MKQRLVVMNGQRIVQTEKRGNWENQDVEKAGELKPGFYNIFTAQPADKSKSHSGAVVHVDKSRVYQQVGKKFVMHSRRDFVSVPSVGSRMTITYGRDGAAQAKQQQQSRSRSR